MDASGEKREIGRTSITPIRKVQGKTYSSDTLGVSLIRNLKARAGRSTSAKKWTPRRAVNCTSPSSCRSLTKFASSWTKSVFLHDWWLINADGKGLAVGGFTHINERKILFHSAVIVKRHDAVTVETIDGMTVLISGNINRPYSLGNGFSLEILNRFMVGFPCDWEEYASGSMKPSDKPSSNNLVTSLDQIPVRNIGDFMSSISVNDKALLMKNMYEDLQRQLGKTPEKASVDSKNHQATKATSNGGIQSKRKLPDGNQTSGTAEIKAAVEKEQANLNATDANHLLVSKRRVFTRSMTKVKTDVPDNIFQYLP